MTTCSSSSEHPDSTSISDVEEYVDHFATGEILCRHVQEWHEASSRLKTAGVSDSDCDDLTASSPVSHFSDSMQQITEVEPGCNGVLAGVDIRSKPTCSTSSSFRSIADTKLHDSVTACLANGLVSEVTPVSTMNHVASSEVQSSSFTDSYDNFNDRLLEGTVVSEPASSTTNCQSHAVSSELKPSVVNSIPLLSIPHTDHICDDRSSFSILPSLSSSTTEGTVIQVMPPSVFSVPCDGKGSDSFTDVSLDDDVEVPRTVNVNTDTLSVPPTISTESSRASSPSRLQLATSLSNLQLDDAIVQSLLCDDEDDDSSHAVGSSRHSTPVAFSTNTDSAAFRTPGSTSSVPCDDDGLHVAEPDNASFEEISLQSSSASVEFHSVGPEQPPTSDTKHSSVANFFAR